jgi:hypothetical protein
MRIQKRPFLSLLLLPALFQSFSLKAQVDDTDSIIRGLRVFRVQGEVFIASLTPQGCFIMRGSDTIVRHLGDYFFSITSKDFNKDGFLDILLDRSENTPGVVDLLLYDPKRKTFKAVQDFDLFPDPSPIPGTRLYYSYHRAGCADMDWESDLFYLDHYCAVRIGNILGNGCDGDPKQSIRMYKITPSGRKLMGTLPIETIGKYKDYKWGFIRNYWVRHCRKYL